jgi:hypothetical protein
MSCHRFGRSAQEGKKENPAGTIGGQKKPFRLVGTVSAGGCSMGYPRICIAFVVFAHLGLGTTSTVFGSAADETRLVFEEWVKIRALLSEERESWLVERQDLADTMDMLTAEKEILEAQIAARNAAAEESVGARANLSERRAELDRVATALASIIEDREAELKIWTPTLPLALQDTINPLVRRLPQSPESAAALGLARRLQSVVGILSQADRFNSTLTSGRELRTDPATGEQREFDTLYFGLASAFFVNDEGTVGGIGKPGPEGWVWETIPDAAPSIRRLLAVHRSEIRAAYVGVPLQIQR